MSITQSDTVFPQGNRQRRDWPAHTKQMKQEVFDVFKNCTGEVTSTDVELSNLDDVVHPFLWMRKFTSILSNNSYLIFTGSNLSEILSGYRFCLQCDTANEDNPTVQIDNVDPIELVDQTQSAISAGFIPANAVFEIIYETTNNRFQILKI